MNWNYASIIVVFILGIIGLIIDFQREKGRKVPSWIFSSILILIISSTIIIGIIKYQEDEKAKYSANSGTILEGISNSNAQKIIYLVGTSTFVGFQNRTIFGKNGVISIDCEDDILFSRIENGKLKISSVLRDKEGHIVARIISNEWTVNPKFMWDKNFDDAAFEVVDDKNNIILQVLLNGDIVRIYGNFYCKGNLMSFNGKGIQLYSDKEISIEPIFKYPSIDHPAERISTQK